MLKENEHHITGYVIIPNHVLATIEFKKKNINKIIGDGKRFIGYDIVKCLKEINETALLNRLAVAINKSDKAKSKLYEIGEDSFDSKGCISDEFSRQKINCMYTNCAAANLAYRQAGGSFMQSLHCILTAQQDFTCVVSKAFIRFFILNHRVI